MQWDDRGIVLNVRPHGETAAIATLLTRDHGRHAGLLRGGARARAPLQPGCEALCHWNARLDEHLGAWRLEIRRNWTAEVLEDGVRLAGVAAIAALLDAGLPEREPHPALHDATGVLLEALASADQHWPELFVRWELGLLAELGFGLDLSTCAQTGQVDDLTHVSPKTGRAVCGAAAAPYAGRLLPLPAFLVPGRGGAEAGGGTGVADGLALTGHFLEARLFRPHNRDLPSARGRLVARLSAAATKSGISEA